MVVVCLAPRAPGGSVRSRPGPQLPGQTAMRSCGSLIALAVAGASLCACATHPQMAAQDALNACILADSQTGWHYLGHPPPNADALRTAMLTSNRGSRLKAAAQEYWFSHTDGRIMRCTLHPQFVAPGTPEICGAVTNIFTPHNQTWVVQDGPLLMCRLRAK